jgi:hypothetical protein
MVAADFGINPAAARMRWARLRKNTAQNSGFKNDPNLPQSFGQQNRKRKSDCSRSRKKGKMLKSEGELDDDDDWIKREMEAEEGGGETGGFGGDFRMGITDGAGIGQHEMAGIQSSLGGLGPVTEDIGFVGNIGDTSRNGTGRGERRIVWSTEVADVLDPMLVSTPDASTSTSQGLCNPSLGLTTPPTGGSGCERSTSTLQALPPPQPSIVITMHPTLSRIWSPIPVPPHISITNSKAETDTTTATTTTATTTAITNTATVNPTWVTDSQHANQRIAQADIASHSTPAVDGTTTPEPVGKDGEYRHDGQWEEATNNGIEAKGRVMQKEGCANEIAGEENKTCLIDKGPTTLPTANSIADTYTCPNATKKTEEGEGKSQMEQQMMCPQHSGRAYDDDTPPSPPSSEEGQVDDILPTSLRCDDLASELSDLSGLPETEWVNEPIVSSISVKPHSSPNAELVAFPPGDNKDVTSNEAWAASAVATSGRLLRSVTKNAGDEIVVIEGNDDEDQGGEEGEEYKEDWIKTENEEEEYEVEESDDEWIE